MTTFFASSAASVDTVPEVVAYAAQILARHHILDPTARDHVRGVEMDGPSYLLDLIDDLADAVAYLPEADGTIDALVARQVIHAHGLGMPVFRIIGRDVVRETVPLRLAS